MGGVELWHGAILARTSFQYLLPFAALWKAGNLRDLAIGLAKVRFFKKQGFAWQLTKLTKFSSFAKFAKSADAMQKTCFSTRRMLISQIKR
jgi:hypothetical protein